MLASPIPSFSPYNLNLNFSFDFQHQPATSAQTPSHQPLAPLSHNVPSPRSGRTLWRQQQPLMAKRSLRSGASDHYNTFNDTSISKQPQHPLFTQTATAFPIQSHTTQSSNTHTSTALPSLLTTPTQPATSQTTQQQPQPQNPLSRTPSQRRNAQRTHFLDSVSKRRETQLFESRGERMLHLQALEERRAWEREQAWAAAFEAGNLEGDDGVEEEAEHVDVEGDGNGDGHGGAGVDAEEVLEDVLGTEERAMQELVAAHENLELGSEDYAIWRQSFDRPCERWMRYHHCAHANGHCGYRMSLAQQQDAHEGSEELPLPQMDQSMDGGEGGKGRGDCEDAASVWGSDAMDSSFEDELWRIGEAIGGTSDGNSGGDGDGGEGDEMDIS